MIKDDKQLANSQQWVEKFAEANRKLKANEEKRLKIRRVGNAHPTDRSIFSKIKSDSYTR